MLQRLATKIMFPSGARARLVVLIYHQVLTTKDPVRPGEVLRKDFDWQMELMSRTFNMLPLSEALEKLRHGNLPPKAACITFDDGYMDNVTEALPILQKYGIPATFFIATSFLQGGRMWNDMVLDAIGRTSKEELDLSSLNLGLFKTGTDEEKLGVVRKILPKLKYLPMTERLDNVHELVDIAQVDISAPLMMGESGVTALYNAGMEIGAHTHNHPILSRCSLEESKTEIATSKSILEDIIGEKVQVFAYPNGRPGSDYDRNHRDLVESLGFEGSVSTSHGSARQYSDVYQVPRFTPWDKQPNAFLVRLISNSWMAKPNYI